MSIEEWLRWPTKSSDPALNAAIAVLLALAIIAAVAIGAAMLLPAIIVIAIIKGIHWYVNRPVPTDQLYAQTQQRVISASFPDAEKFMEAHLDRLLDAIRDDLPTYSIFLSMAHITEAMYKSENLNNPLPPLAAATAIEEGRYRDQLIAQQRKTIDAPRTLEIFNGTLGKVYLDFIAQLPPVAKSTLEDFSKCEDVKSFATFPLIDVLPNAGKSVFSLTQPFFSEEVEAIGLFTNLRKQLERNYADATSAERSGSNAKLLTPDKYKGTPREIVTAYLSNTPFEALFYAPVPFSISDRQRYEHTHVVGGSGHGKTQFLQRLILTDLERTAPPALVIIDSQGEMLTKIRKLALFAPGGKLAEKVISIDPEDVEHPPALNIFAQPTNRIEGYSKSIQEQVEAGTIELFNYIFGAIAAELTSRQNTTFAYVTRLMLSIPGSTIHTLRELFEGGAATIDASPFREYIRRLDATSQGFFQNQFFTKAYSQTRSQIARRLYGVLQVPSFDRMFSASENKLDMFEAMHSGKVVLVNTSKALLKTDASALFGRYMIARVIAAAYERIAIPASKRNPAFLIVDEAAEYFDENLETLLSQARKFNVGILFAHQHLEQLTSGLRASVAANTSIKLAGGVSDKDARALASDMRTIPEFITGMTKHARSTEFACYVRNYTSNAVRLSIPFGALEAAPKMSREEEKVLLLRNRERYGAALSTQAEPVVTRDTLKTEEADPPKVKSADTDLAETAKKNDPPTRSSKSRDEGTASDWRS